MLVIKNTTNYFYNVIASSLVKFIFITNWKKNEKFKNTIIRRIINRTSKMIHIFLMNYIIRYKFLCTVTVF